jgi:hypothetical protein
MGWPGLTAARVRKHLPKSEETAFGHLKLVRQNIRSTSKGEIATEDTPEPTGECQSPVEDFLEEDAQPTAQEIGRRRLVSACSMPLNDLKGIIGTDQTG